MLDALTLLLTIFTALCIGIGAGYGAILGLLHALGRQNRPAAPPMPAEADLQPTPSA